MRCPHAPITPCQEATACLGSVTTPFDNDSHFRHDLGMALPPHRLPRLAAAWVAGLTALALVGGCSSGASGSAGTGPSGSGSTGSDAAAGQIAVVAGFYPLAYAVQRVGGAHVSVTNLTKPGAEPHDAEPTTADVGAVKKARVLVTLGGFQPSVDALVAQATSEQRVLDAATITGALGNIHSSAGVDLHFWLDPTNYAAFVEAVGTTLASVDPANAATYRSNVAAFVADLVALDTAYATGLKTCTSRTMVTGHQAFGYLAARYGLTQVGIAGVNPEQEPSAKDLAAVAETVRSAGVHTIYTETLVEPKFAQTVASSTGATLAVLDPVEGITDASPGKDYLEVMRANLAALRKGQECS